MRRAGPSLLALIGLIAACDRAPRAPEEVISRVDSRIYYPQRLGIKRLSAQVRCPHLDEHFQKKMEEISEAAAFLQKMIPLQVRFTWDPKAGGRYEYLSVPEEEKELRSFLDQAFGGTEILVVPPTEAENFRPFNVNFGLWQDKYRLTGINREPESNFTQYSVIADQTFKIIGKQYYTPDYVSTTVPTYREEKHRLLLTDLVTFQKGIKVEKNVNSEVHLTYQQVQGFWLVKSLEYVFKEKTPQGDKVFRGPLLINYTDYQIETK